MLYSVALGSPDIYRGWTQISLFLYTLSATITCKLHPSVYQFYIDTEWVILKDGIIQQIYSSFIIGWTFFLKKVQDNTLIVKLKFVNWKIEGYLRVIRFLYCFLPINTLMFLKNIGLIEKNIRMIVNKHTVDWRQTPIVCRQSTVSLSTNVLMFFSINLMFLKNIKVFISEIQCKKRITLK